MILDSAQDREREFSVSPGSSYRWHSVRAAIFPLAGVGGYDPELAVPYTPDRADYINRYNPAGTIDEEQTSPMTVNDNTPQVRLFFRRQKTYHVFG